MAEWISVKERLPDNFQSVLVRRKDGGIFIWMYSEESPTDDVWIDDYCNAFSLYDSTHWMPLPEPPKEGGGEADKKTNCSDCVNRYTPVCKYCEHDAEGGGE